MHGHDHEHEDLHFQGSDVAEDALAALRETHAALAECLDLTRRWTTLADDERKRAAESQAAVEKAEGWMPGYHADGDRCATCGVATRALFTDRYAEGALAFAAFLRGLPVHATRACLDGFAVARPDASPRGLDRARRELMRDLDRPTPRMTQFLRHDVLAHPPFGLEDWGNSVADAQKGGLDRKAQAEIEKLLRYTHAKLFHA